MALIDIKKLSVTYFLGKSNEVRALNDASLEIEAGEFVIFFGASGCGKSTLLYTIAGLENPTQGKVKVDMHDLAEMKNGQLESYRQKVVGMIFQAFHLIPSLTVEKNITMPKVAVGANLKERTAEAEKLMKYFGVFEQRHKLPTELSGGQQQRVAICRALINDPDIVLADEPVGNLDSKSAADVMGLIQQLNIDHKKTVILVTHDPSHLDIADKVFFMKDGQIIDVKINKDNKRVIAPKTAGTETKNNLELISKSFGADEKNGWSGLMLDYKAKEVVTETLTDMSSAEMTKIENIVKEILRDNARNYKKLIKYLDTDEDRGGLGLTERLAKKLTNKLETIANEMKLVSKLHEKSKNHQVNYPARVRKYLLDKFDARIKNSDTVGAIETIIAERMAGWTDRKGVMAKLCAPAKEGGVGLRRKLANKMAKHLELILFGRYQASLAVAPADFNKLRP